MPEKASLGGAGMLTTVLAGDVKSSSLRNAVKELHAHHGCPAWSLSETVNVCIAVDAIHEARGICSSSRFRENRRDERFLNRWVLACDFQWLSSD